MVAMSDPAGVREEFERLLRPLLDPSFGLAYSMTRNAADAEDVVQEAAMRAFAAFDSFERGTNFKAWFYRIVTNCCYARHRRSRRRPEEVDLDDAGEVLLYRMTRGAGLYEQTNDPARRLLERISAERIARAIASLPDEYQAAAALYFLEEYAYQEIAEILAIPVGTVRSRLHRGRRMLQKLLWQVAQEDGIIDELSAEATV